MARVGFLADVHAANFRKCGGTTVNGVNERCALITDALAGVGALIDAQHLDGVVVAGDIFNSDIPPPAVTYAVMVEVQKWARKCKVVLLPGNHDQHSDQLHDHALAPLEWLENVTVMQRPELIPIGDVVVACVPFRKGDAREWFNEAVQEAVAGAGKRTKILAFHLGVEDSITPHYLQNSHDSIKVDLLAEVCAGYEIAAAFAGNWHTPKRWSYEGIEMVQCGAFCPTGWQNEGLDYGFVTVYDTELGQLAIHQVPGPRFTSVKFVPTGDNLAKGLFVRIKASTDVEVQAALDWIAKHAPGRGDVQFIPPEDDKTSTAAEVVEEGTPTAMFGGAKAEVLVHRYIEAMPLAEGVERPVVHGLVNRALFAKKAVV